jgi:ABC-type sugar transport system permease subunit
MKTPRPSARPYPRWIPWFFVAPFLLTFGTFVAWPLVRSLVLSFEQTYGPRTAVFVGLRNYSFLLHDPLFWKALTNTVVFTAGSLFAQVPVSLGLALLLNRPGLKGRTWFRLIFFAPSLVGLVFVALMVALVFEKRTGLINVSLHALFAAWDPDFAWLDQHVMLTLVIAVLWLCAGLNMVYFLAALQNVSPELIEAAAIDGASAWQRFWHVTLPEIRPVLSLVVLISLTASFQLFELPYILFNTTGDPAGPNNSGITIVMYLYQAGFLVGDLGYASAVGWLLAIVLTGLMLAQRRAAVRTED